MSNPTTEARRYVARCLNLNPHNEAEWPLKTLDGLVALRAERGESAFIREINQMMTDPNPTTKRKPPKSWSTCPHCYGRATKILHLGTGLVECQQCDRSYVPPGPPPYRIAN